MNYFKRTIFNILIIASALLMLDGCGHKADPFYSASHITGLHNAV